ncbi:hypothetical protein PHYPO_G00132790 [Pangasianodon hypophthalmus]|uniref:Uncharacterized protein n=1 Tax=Pangasianodon hypophthalmus TaxID=310915 RepID=A0A5N5KK23_PANHP|nr:hypothetical protein PHYPO_G00132790 [Pangasianodon hypophthalmus]
MCGVRVRTACHSCSWHRTTSPPADTKPCWRSLTKSSDPSDLSWVFQTLMTIRTSSTMETWRRKQRRTISRWVLANNMLIEVDRPSTGQSVASFPLFFSFFQAIFTFLLVYDMHYPSVLHTCTHAPRLVIMHDSTLYHVGKKKKNILGRPPVSFLFYLASPC